MSKNTEAATLPASAAAKAGILGFRSREDADAAILGGMVNSRKLFGFTRKQLPSGLPTEPKLYIYSVSDYGEDVYLGPGFPVFTIHPAKEGKARGKACVIDPIYFMEEAKVDVTEHTPFTGQQIVDAILKVGPGMNASLNRARVGWFCSATNPPADAEVQAAIEVYTAECKRLLAEANLFASKNSLNEITDTHRRAAKFLRQNVTWDKPQEKMVDCPRCGEPVRAGAVVHATPYCGHVFQLLPYWLSMVESGQKVLADAPESIQAELAKELKKAR